VSDVATQKGTSESDCAAESMLSGLLRRSFHSFLAMTDWEIFELLSL
jgi:hypothetical protein